MQLCTHINNYVFCKKQRRIFGAKCNGKKFRTNILSDKKKMLENISAEIKHSPNIVLTEPFSIMDAHELIRHRFSWV